MLERVQEHGSHRFGVGLIALGSLGLLYLLIPSTAEAVIEMLTPDSEDNDMWRIEHCTLDVGTVALIGKEVIPPCDTAP